MPKMPVIALAFVLALPAMAHAQTWEYKVQEVDLISKVRVFANDLLLSADELETTLGPLGGDGWELVTSLPRGGTSLLLVFKRPVAPAPLAVIPPPLVHVPPVEQAPAPPTEAPAEATSPEEPAADPAVVNP
jgi:hypothetical protein